MSKFTLPTMERHQTRTQLRLMELGITLLISMIVILNASNFWNAPTPLNHHNPSLHSSWGYTSSDIEIHSKADWETYSAQNEFIQIEQSQYIIENCSLIAAHLNITYTNMSVIIRNCYFENTDYGISIENCGHITIVNNTINMSAGAGISIQSGEQNITYITLHNNSLYSTASGLMVYGDIYEQNTDISHLTITNNTIKNTSSNYGLLITKCHNASVRHNHISNSASGIGLFANICSNITISQNVFEDDDIIYLFHHDESEWLYNNISIINGTNIRNGKPIIVYQDQETPPSSQPQEIGQLILLNCSNLTLQEINAPILTYYSTNLTVQNNTITNAFVGILLQGSSTTIFNSTNYIT
ncbi:MAG: hypothetical protein EU548_09260, partial [Promethearchaeota archaeon]